MSCKVDVTKLNILLWTYGISEEELCEQAGVNKSVLDKIRNSDFENVKLGDLNKIATYFHISTKLLLID